MRSRHRAIVRPNFKKNASIKNQKSLNNATLNGKIMRPRAKIEHCVNVVSKLSDVQELLIFKHA